MKILILFAIFALAVARPGSDDLTAEEAELAAQLENADLEEVDFEIEPLDSVETRWFGMKQHIKENCNCEGNKCECCGRISIAAGFKLKGCAGVTLHANERVFEFRAGFADNEIARNLSVAHLERSCKKIYWEQLKVCVYNHMKDTVEDGLTVCLSLDAVVFNSTVASLHMHCLQFKDKQLSFPEHPETGRQSVFTLKMKNPIKLVIDYFKKKFDNSPLPEKEGPAEGWENVKPTE